MIRTFHYAQHWQAIDFLRLGWIIAKPNCIMPHFDFYGVTMEWLCECEVVRPNG